MITREMRLRKVKRKEAEIANLLARKEKGRETEIAKDN